MNKKELCAKIAELTGISKSQAACVVATLCDSVVEAVANGDTVQLVGFGTFLAKDRAARDGRNPRTGELIKIPACKTPVFKAGSGFKEAVNGKK